MAQKHQRKNFAYDQSVSNAACAEFRQWNLTRMAAVQAEPYSNGTLAEHQGEASGSEEIGDDDGLEGLDSIQGWFKPEQFLDENFKADAYVGELRRFVRQRFPQPQNVFAS
eukprot:scaffold533340_cov45-Prasinocladus_malaysianus.AAC.1